MHEYVTPEITFIELGEAFSTEDSICWEYECPESYGNICTGRPYNGG